MARYYKWLHWKGGRDSVPGTMQSRARVLLDELETMLARSSIESGSRTVNMNDGSSLTVAITLGMASVRYAPGPQRRPKRPKFRFLERAYIGLEQNGTNLLVIDLAEYEVDEGRLRRTKELFELVHQGDYGAYVRCIATGAVNLAAEQPIFPDFYYIHTFNYTGDPSSTVIHKVDILTNEIVLTMPSAEPGLEPLTTGTVNLARNQVCFGYTSLSVHFYDAETLTPLGNALSLVSTYLTSPAYPHTSGDYYFLPCREGFSGDTLLYVVSAENFESISIFNFASLGPGVAFDVFIAMSMSRNQAYAVAWGTSPSDALYHIKLGAVAIDNADYPPAATVGQPYIDVFDKVTDDLAAGQIDVSRAGGRLVYEVFPSIGGATRHIQGSPTNPVTRVLFPRTDEERGTIPRLSADGERVYYASYGTGPSDQRLFVSTTENLGDVERFVQLPPDLTEDPSLLVRLEITYVELGIE